MVATIRAHLRADRPLSLLDGVLAFVLWLVSYLVYMRTLFPYPLNNDSAEFAVLAKQVGVTHNPGYPIYIVLAHLWSYLPAGDIAYRVNLFSAFMAAVAVAGVYVATTLLSRERVAGVMAAAALAVSWTFWSQAVIAEVYTSGAAVLSIILACVFGWYRTGARWPLFVAGLCGALSLGIHSTTALLAPAIVVCLLIAWRGRPNPWPHAIAGVGTGLVLYAVIFILVDLNAPPASMFNTSYTPNASSFGLDPATFDSVLARVWFNASAGQWRGAMFAVWNEAPRRALQYSQLFGREFSPLMLALMVVGFGLMCWRVPAAAALIGLGLVLEWSFVFSYRIGDYYVFHIAGYVLLAIAAGFGLGQLVGFLARRAGRAGPAVRGVTFLLVLALAVWPTLAPRWPDVVAGRVPFENVPGYPVSSDTVATYIGITAQVSELPPNAILFVGWAHLYTYWYAASIAGTRTDLRFIEPYNDPRSNGLPDSTVAFIRDNLATRPIFFTFPMPGLLERGLRYERVIVGGAEMYQVFAD